MLSSFEASEMLPKNSLYLYPNAFYPTSYTVENSFVSNSTFYIQNALPYLRYINHFQCVIQLKEV